MRADLVPGRNDLRDQLGMPIGNPSHDEEGGAGAGPVQVVEEQPGRLHDPRPQ